MIASWQEPRRREIPELRRSWSRTVGLEIQQEKKTEKRVSDVNIGLQTILAALGGQLGSGDENALGRVEQTGELDRSTWGGGQGKCT